MQLPWFLEGLWRSPSIRTNREIHSNTHTNWSHASQPRMTDVSISCVWLIWHVPCYWTLDTITFTYHLVPQTHTHTHTHTERERERERETCGTMSSWQQQVAEAASNSHDQPSPTAQAECKRISQRACVCVCVCVCVTVSHHVLSEYSKTHSSLQSPKTVLTLEWEIAHLLSKTKKMNLKEACKCIQS